MIDDIQHAGDIDREGVGVNEVGDGGGGYGETTHKNSCFAQRWPFDTDVSQ